MDLTQFLNCIGHGAEVGTLTTALGVSDDGSSILAVGPNSRMFLVTGFSPTVINSTDINLDGSTDGKDLALLLGAWGTSGQGLYGTDIDNDGLVEGKDLAYLLSGWAPCP